MRYSVVCDTCKHEITLGIRHASGVTFGIGVNDYVGCAAAMNFIVEHNGDGCELRIVNEHASVLAHCEGYIPCTDCSGTGAKRGICRACDGSGFLADPEDSRPPRR